ncbi:MAG: helix-turn-helix transcriptional regulator [Planctomycetes bacterium]|nr:helix-turn-helix transcriptional regulator [Planctomycetota bacterium]
MDLANRCFVDTRTDPALPGLVTLPLEVPYRAQLIHATWRQSCQRTQRAGTRQPHAHDVYHIVLVSGGSGTFVIGDEIVAVSGGDLFITSPGDRHSFNALDGEDTEYCELTWEFVNPQGGVLTRPFHEALSAWTGRPCPRIGRARAGAELHLAIMNEIQAIARAGFSQVPDHALVIAEAIARVFMALYTRLHATQPPDADRLLPVQHHIDRHYRELLSLEQLARLCGFTPNYLSRRFKARFGATPIVYQHRLRINAAASLLRTTDHPIREIADLVGYHDVHVFTRSFRSHEGMPPGRYRKERWGPQRA